MFEFSVEEETNKHSLNAEEAEKVAQTIGGLWNSWNDARHKQKEIIEKLRPEIYLDDRKTANRGEDDWKSDVHLNKIYALQQTQSAFIWENIYQSIDRLFDVEGTDAESDSNAALQKANLVNIFYHIGIQRTLDRAIEYLLTSGEFCLFVAWAKKYKQIRRKYSAMENLLNGNLTALFQKGSYGIFRELVYNGADVTAIDPMDLAFDPAISPEDTEKWNACGKIVKSWETYGKIAENKLYNLSREQLREIRQLLTEHNEEEDKASSLKTDEIIQNNRIEVLQYWGNYTLDDGTVLKNWNITVIGRKYLALFEFNRWVINPIVNMAVFRDIECKRGIPEIWSIYDIAKEQEKKVNLQNDAQMLNLNPPAYAPVGFFKEKKVSLSPGKQIEYKPSMEDPNGIIKMQFPLVANEQLIEYYDSTASTVSGIFPNMQGQNESKDATATEINVKVQGQTTRLAKTLDAIKQNGIVPLVTKVAELDANMKFGDETIFYNDGNKRVSQTIGDTVRQGHYTYKYTDNSGIQRRTSRNRELVSLLANVWNDPAVPLNKVQIVKDILANADFADTEKYFLSNAAPAEAEQAALGGVAQAAPAENGSLATLQQ